ncbi:hypothetical protein IE53DRAFT_166954 [Violaceomyces palustris]|uniref:Uncharacterized protein n=1 Tax=Violaceomyces palustris TaxID=1673888 RepID=A0ACD0NTE4_9BASI|nr:hypothetical protein IE53DRAFT_166954 [Violaceomyces palustris]
MGIGDWLRISTSGLAVSVCLSDHMHDQPRLTPDVDPWPDCSKHTSLTHPLSLPSHLGVRIPPRLKSLAWPPMSSKLEHYCNRSFEHSSHRS